jgi:IS605 OrfB family transposase
VNDLLHQAVSHFLRECVSRGVGEVVVGDFSGLREGLDYGEVLNQRLHAWPYRKLVEILRYKGALMGINVHEVGSSRDFCGFLFHGPKRVHVQVTPESPVLRGPQHHHRGQIHQAPLAREDPNHPGPPLHLTDKPLQHIRALDVPLVAAGKVQVGQGLPQTLSKHLHRPLKPVPVTLNEPRARDSAVPRRRATNTSWSSSATTPRSDCGT